MNFETQTGRVFRRPYSSRLSDPSRSAASTVVRYARVAAPSDSEDVSDAARVNRPPNRLGDPITDGDSRCRTR
eukprot:27518-Hanusia_phi.AAC.1